MQIVEVFLPLDTGSGEPIGIDVIEGIVDDLADRFGGATAFSRSPGEGLWKHGMLIHRDRVVIVEVMVEHLNEAWWKDYRRYLEAKLEQKELLIRVTECRII